MSRMQDTDTSPVVKVEQQSSSFTDLIPSEDVLSEQRGEYTAPPPDHRSSIMEQSGEYTAPPPDHRSSIMEMSGEYTAPPLDHRSSIMDVTSDYINTHLRLFRMLPWAVAGVGAFFIYKYSRAPLRRLCKVGEIPPSVVVDNVPLRGVVQSTGWDSIGVWHVPTWRRLFRIGHKPPDPCPSDELLKLVFAGVSIGRPHEAEAWLQKHLFGQTVSFTPLIINSHRRALESIIYTRRKGLKSECVNSLLIANGLGSLNEVCGAKNHQTYSKLVQSLAKSEQEAKGKGRGMWEGTEYVVWWRRLAKRFRRS